MGREEQVEEREVLESIFPEEITDISESEFRICVTLDIVDQEDEEPPQLLLEVRYSDAYPDTAPHLKLLAPANAPSHPLFSISEDRDQLLDSLSETVEENLGMAMVFTLVSTLKDAAEQLIQSRKDSATEEQEKALLAAEQEENKKFHGTPVTRESFSKWREAFMKEMEERERKEEDERIADLKKAKVKETVKLTGRQLWERGLAGKGDEGEEEEGVPNEALEKLQVEAT